MVSMQLVVTIVVIVMTAGVSADTAVAEYPAFYTLTSAGCENRCTNANFPTDGCIFYPPTGEFPCAETSVGYCSSATALSSATACTVKCLATSFFTDDSGLLPDGLTGKALSLGLRGATGSFGRSEPIQAIQDLTLARVTKLSIKDFVVDIATLPTHSISLLAPSATNRNTSNTVLRTLELVNVKLAFPSTASVLPSTLTKLVLTNNALALESTAPPLRGEVRQDNSPSPTHFPLEIFSLPALTHLDLRGNPALHASSFSSDQLAFFRRLAVFQADFTL